MKIQLYLRTLQRNYLPESEWEHIQALVDTNSLGIQDIMMKVVLSGKQTDTVIVEDVMEPLIQNLCLHASKELLLGNDYTYHYWSYDRTMYMKIKGEKVLLEDDLLPPTLFLKDPLIEQLLLVAQSTMNLMKKLKKAHPAYNFSAYDYFQQMLGECLVLKEQDTN